jgi:hypothetical protein
MPFITCDTFKISKEEARSDSPPKGFAVYLARKHTVFSDTELGKYVGVSAILP